MQSPKGEAFKGRNSNPGRNFFSSYLGGTHDSINAHEIMLPCLLADRFQLTSQGRRNKREVSEGLEHRSGLENCGGRQKTGVFLSVLNRQSQMSEGPPRHMPTFLSRLLLIPFPTLLPCFSRELWPLYHESSY